MQVFERPDVLDGNHGLVRKDFEEGDLLIRERSHLRTANHNSSNRNILSEQRRSKYSMSACDLLNLRGVRELRFKLCRKVMHVRSEERRVGKSVDLGGRRIMSRKRI